MITSTLIALAIDWIGVVSMPTPTLSWSLQCGRRGSRCDTWTAARTGKGQEEGKGKRGGMGASRSTEETVEPEIRRIAAMAAQKAKRLEGAGGKP